MTLRQEICTTLALAAGIALSANAVFAADATSQTTPSKSAAVPKALQEEISAFQMKQTLAANARDYAAYKKALDQYVASTCTFVDPGDNSVTLPEYLVVLKKGLANRPPGMTEVIKDLGTTMNGDTATENGIVTESENYVDASGKLGPKGRSHRLETKTSFTTKWAKVVGTSALSADAPWLVQRITLLDVSLFVDGRVYTPPPPPQRRPTQRPNNNQSRARGRRR